MIGTLPYRVGYVTCLLPKGSWFSTMVSNWAGSVLVQVL